MSLPFERALSNPHDALRAVLDGPLHPGGYEATEDLLDRAGVGAGTRILDLGCGEGGSVALARDRGARAVGLDREPGGDRAVRGDLRKLPIRSNAVDVAVAECALCLSPDLERSLGEVRRVLDRGGRLAVSDVVVEGPVPDLPSPLPETLCLSGARSRAALCEAIETAGFEVDSRRDHHEDLLAMRDRITDRVDYEGLLGALGERGRRLRDGVDDLRAAVEDERIGYVSVVATREP